MTENLRFDWGTLENKRGPQQPALLRQVSDSVRWPSEANALASGKAIKVAASIRRASRCSVADRQSGRRVGAVPLAADSLGSHWCLSAGQRNAANPPPTTRETWNSDLVSSLSSIQDVVPASAQPTAGRHPAAATQDTTASVRGVHTDGTTR